MRVKILNQRGSSQRGGGVVVAVIIVAVIAAVGVAVMMGTKNNIALMWAKSANNARALSLDDFQKRSLRDAKLLLSTHKAVVLAANEGATLPIAGWKRGATQTTTTGEFPLGTFSMVYNLASGSDYHAFAEVKVLEGIKAETLNSNNRELRSQMKVNFSYIYSDTQGGAQVRNATYVVRPQYTSDIPIGGSSSGLGSTIIPLGEVLGTEDVKVTTACPADATERAAYLANVKKIHETTKCQAPAMENASTRVKTISQVASAPDRAALDLAAANLATANANYNTLYSAFLASLPACGGSLQSAASIRLGVIQAIAIGPGEEEEVVFVPN